MLGSQLGPDAFPRRAAQQATMKFSACGALDFEGLGGVHVAPAGQALVQVGLADPGKFGKAFALRKRERTVERWSGHTPHGSDSLHPPQEADSPFAAIRYVKMPTASNSELLESRMETGPERRRRKLTELCLEHTAAAVAKKAGQNRYALEQIIKGVRGEPREDGSRVLKGLGNKAARAIEAAYGLGEGWFDAPDDPGSLSREAIMVAEFYDRAPKAVKLVMARMVPSVDIDLDEPSEPALPHLGGSNTGLGDLDSIQDKKKKAKK